MRGLSLGAVCGLLIAVASLVAERRLWGLQASVVVAQGLGYAMQETPVQSLGREDPLEKG